MPVRPAGRAAGLPDGQALGIREIYPHISIAFFTWKNARENAIGLEL
jgi:hypothetical protein